MMGVPEETLEDMKETYEFVKKAVKKGAYLFLFVATPYPGGEFWEIAKNKKKVSEEMDFTKLSLYSCHNPLLLDEKIDKEKFAELFFKNKRIVKISKIQDGLGNFIK